MNFLRIKETINAIRQGIEKRYGKLSALPGVRDSFRRIDYIIQRLDIWIKDKELTGNDDAEVFLDCFRDRFDELEKMLTEIDHEFTKRSTK